MTDRLAFRRVELLHGRLVWCLMAILREARRNSAWLDFHSVGRWVILSSDGGEAPSANSLKRNHNMNALSLKPTFASARQASGRRQLHVCAAQVRVVRPIRLQILRKRNASPPGVAARIHTARRVALVDTSAMWLN